MRTKHDSATPLCIPSPDVESLPSFLPRSNSIADFLEDPQQSQSFAGDPQTANGFTIWKMLLAVSVCFAILFLSNIIASPGKQKSTNSVDPQPPLLPKIENTKPERIDKRGIGRSERGSSSLRAPSNPRGNSVTTQTPAKGGTPKFDETAFGQRLERVGGYTIESSRLPKGWQRIDGEGMVKLVRDGLEKALPGKNLNKVPGFDTDSTIIRWLIGKNLDVKEVIEGLVAKNAYWEQNNLHQKFQEWADTVKDPQTELPHIGHMQRLQKDYPLLGYAKDGSPVAMTRLGFSCSKAYKLEKEGLLEYIEKYSMTLNVYRDRMLYTMSERDKHIHSFYAIYDMAGIGVKHLWNKGLVERILGCVSRDAKKYYVENAKKVYVCNAGYGICAFLSIFFNKRMKSKVSTATGINSEMKKVFDENILPPDMGGTNTRWGNQ